MNTLRKLNAAFISTLLSLPAFAHEGHGSGVAHDLHHVLWLVAGAATGLLVLVYASRRHARQKDGK